MSVGDGIRRNLATVSKAERDRLRDAIVKLQTQPQYHFPGARSDTPVGGVSWWFKQDEIHAHSHVHGVPAFVPWHRELINRFETMIRTVDPQLSLHYWDWTQDPRNLPDSVGGTIDLFAPDFLGNSSGLAGEPLQASIAPFRPDGFYVPGASPARSDNEFDPNNNPFDPPLDILRAVGAFLQPVASDSSLLAAATFKAFHDLIKINHDHAHGYIGGTLGDAHTSFRDPTAFFLHSNLDRLFAMWQRDAAHPERLDPTHVYDYTPGDWTSDPEIGSGDVATGGPWWGFKSPMEPWASPGAQTAATGIVANVQATRPWAPPENQQVVKDSRDPSVVLPPRYDTTPATTQGWIQRTVATSPPARFGACIAYDPTRGQVILFGGESYQAGFADTWAWDGTNWTQLAPATSPPGVVYGHMAFDPIRSVVVLWGGVAAGGTYPADTWTWNGSTWTRHTTASPPGRSNGMMAWDGNRIILYGGETNNVRRADMWAWDGQSWTKLSDVAAPGIRVGAVMTYFPDNQRVVMHGGSSDTQTLSDTWQWDRVSWTQQNPVANPGYRVAAAAAFDGTLVFIFGGARSAAVPLLGDLWAWDTNNWRTVSNQGPSARRAAAVAQYPSGPGIVLFGGDDNVHNQALSDTWTYGAAPPPPRCFVATALFGPLSPEVVTLRAFRDERLMQHALSRALVRNYYRHGPKLAALTLRFPILEKAMRSSIRVCVRLLGLLAPD